MKSALSKIKKATSNVKTREMLLECSGGAPIFLSDEDKEIFFSTLMNTAGPNQKLREAAQCYKEFMQANQ